MKDPRLKMDDLRYPDFLQKAMIGYIFRSLHPFTEEEVTRRGLKNRNGKVKWDSKTIFNIFKRWKDKL